MAPTTRFARNLGLLEKYQVYRYFHSSPEGTIFTGLLRHPRQSQDTKTRSFYTALVVPALIQLLNRHPILSVVIKNAKSPRVHFEHLSSIDLYNLIELDYYDNSGTFNQMINISWDFGMHTDTLEPLWKIYIYRRDDESCYMTLAVQHVISDTLGVSVLWRELLRELNKPLSEEAKKQMEQKLQQEENHYVVQLPPDLELESSYETYDPPEPSFFADTLPHAFNLIGSKMLPNSVFQHIDPSIASWKGDSPVSNGSTSNPGVRFFQVDVNEWQLIINKAEEKKIPTDAVVFVSALLAWTKVYPKCCETVETITPVDCRSLCNRHIPETRIGDFASFYSTFWTNNPDLRKYQNNPWDLAKKYYHDLQKNKVDSAKQVLLLKHLPEYPSVSREFMGFTVKNSDLIKHGGIEISDLGGFDEHTDLASGWKLFKLYLFQRPQFSKSYAINSVTLNNTLYCTLSYEKDLLKDKNVDQLINAFKSVIDRFLEN